MLRILPLGAAITDIQAQTVHVPPPPCQQPPLKKAFLIAQDLPETRDNTQARQRFHHDQEEEVLRMWFAGTDVAGERYVIAVANETGKTWSKATSFGEDTADNQRSRAFGQIKR